MPSEIGPVSPVRAVRTGPFAASFAEAGDPAPAASPPPALRIDVSALAAAPPFDPDRVGQIRSAIADGSYPLIPARIADAMIAAGLRLSLGE